jgi:CHAT domain-containing protein
VDDEATKEFMITFYRNYLSGGDSRAAYLETVREMREQYERPFYWGAFVYVE